MVAYLWISAVLILVGFIAGFVNTISGSGSLLTLPILMFLGLPAGVANGTNRVGVLVQNLVGTLYYRKKKLLDYREGHQLILPAAIGGLVGAVLAVNTSDQLMEKVIGVVLLVMFLIYVLRPERQITKYVDRLQQQFPTLQNLICFFIGIYGGYIQVGVGFLFLALLVIAQGHNMERANALKVYLGLIFTICSLVIFFINWKVDVLIGLILAVGNMLGAMVATRWFAVNETPKFLRLFVSAISLGLCLLFAFKYLHLLPSFISF